MIQDTAQTRTHHKSKDTYRPSRLAMEVLVGLLIAIVAGLMGIYGARLGSGHDGIERHTAEQFLFSYYDEVTDPDSVEHVWESRLAPELKNKQDLPDFVDWWSGWSDVRFDGQVQPQPDLMNGFVARIAYVDAGGETHSFRQVVYELECADPLAGHVPGAKCDIDDVRLVDTWQPATG